MSAELLETCRGLKYIIEETVRQVGHLPEVSHTVLRNNH
jgi:hypothetical protein